MKKIAYLGMDVHQNHCVLGEMDSTGEFRGTSTFPTSETRIIHALESVKAKEKMLTLEEGNLALREYLNFARPSRCHLSLRPRAR